MVDSCLDKVLVVVLVVTLAAAVAFDAEAALAAAAAADLGTMVPSLDFLAQADWT